MLENKIVNGDCLTAIPKHIESESVDLIYLDPPFFSNRNYEIIWGNGAELEAFGDRWKGGINVYIAWMEERIREMHKALKPTGSFFLHCDKHASHYLRIMCDDIFGYKNFVNEIIWSYGARATPRKKGLNNKHDMLFWYSKGKNYTYKPILLPYKDKKMGRYNKIDEKGRYASIKRRRSDGTVYYGKSYVKEGVPATSVWDIPTMASTSKERLGYPTQKPEALLDRVLLMASNEGDLILDPFVGGGTTIAVANRLNRKWIGIDVSPIACTTSYRRLYDKVRTIDIIDYPVTKQMVMTLKPLAFQQWVVVQLGGDVSPTFTADGGIDGKFPDGTPIEVKQTSAGRPVIQKFHSVIITEKKGAGVVIATSFPKSAVEHVAKIKRDSEIEIILLTLDDLLDHNYEKIRRAGIKMNKGTDLKRFFKKGK